MKFIVFDGDFHEAEVEWLAEWQEDETWEAYSDRMGFSSAWSSTGSLDAIHSVAVHGVGDRLAPNRAWYVTVTIAGDHILSFVIEGDLNYLRFLASPFALANVEEALTTLTETVRRAFLVWHGHEAPENRDDHALRSSCNHCDPHFAWNREKEHEEHRERLEQRRQKTLAKEQQEQWVQETRARLDKSQSEPETS